MRGCCGLRDVQLKNEELSLKGKGHKTGQWRDRRQGVCAWVRGGDDRERETEWQTEMTANKWRWEAVKWSWRLLTLTPLYFTFGVFSRLECSCFPSTFILDFWLTLIFFFSPPFWHLLFSVVFYLLWLSISLPPLSLRGSLCTVAQ